MTSVDVSPKTIVSDRFRLWMAAIKPPMYTVAIMPIFWGTALAYQAMGQINFLIFGLFLSAAILILAWENISNDVLDRKSTRLNSSHRT